MQPNGLVSRWLWSAVVLLVLIGVFVVTRRTMHLVPILINGYSPPAIPSNPPIAQFQALDDIFARYPRLTLVHILPALFFLLLAPLQFSQTFRDRHLQLHRRTGRILLLCGVVVGYDCARDELRNAGNRQRQSSSGNHAICFVFSVRIRQGVAPYSAAGNRAPSQWMIRAFSIGLAVATIRPIVGVFFATARFTGLTPYEFFGTAFWIGFVLHLIAAEVWIQWTRPQAFKISSLYLRKETYHGDP